MGKSEAIFYRLINRLLVHLSSPLSFYKLAREAAVASHATVEDYLDILQKMFILYEAPTFALEQRRLEMKKTGSFILLILLFFPA